MAKNKRISDKKVRAVSETSQQEESLARHSEQLEELVKKRTVELEKLNLKLYDEIETRIKAQESLVKLAAYNRALIETSVDPLFIVDTEGRITDVNGSAENMSGSSRQELIGSDFSSLFTEPDKARTVYVQAFGEGQVRNVELEFTGEDGSTFPILFSASVIRERGETLGVCAIGRDISDRKRTENILRRSNVELEMRVAERTAELALKNSELEQIIYVTSHDLRSPLVNIQGFGKELSLALTDLVSLFHKYALAPELPPEVAKAEKDVAEDMQFINSSILKMDSLLTGLLTISRLGRIMLNKETVDMNALAAQIATAFEFQLKTKGARLELSDLPECYADRVRMDQALSNLVDNAIKFLDPNRPGTIRIYGSSNVKETVYCVEDNGIGIAFEHRERVFEIFHRLNPQATRGEGLGLSIVRRIADRHGGRVWVESELGRGSKFFIELPNTRKKADTQ